MTRLVALSIALFWISSARADEPKPPSAEDVAFFEARIRPVLVEKCRSCHGPEKQKSGLRLDSRAEALKGGGAGPAIVPGDPDQSLLVEAVRQTGDLKMPPKDRLPDAVVADLAEWVRRGAAWPESADARAKPDISKTHWAFKKIADPQVPDVTMADWAKSPIDRFLAAKLESKGLSPSAEADRRTLIRRATFDLIGLPPTAEEVSAFEADPATTDEAFAKVVDRLLASPHYGERWGRHWLDVARYGDTKGYVFVEDANYPWAYAYRDWVIRALNEDLPYDQFLIQQIAADRLPLGDDTRPLAAMGFLTAGSRFMNNQDDILDDRIDLVTRGLMGLTVSCARCHDHKFDPIPTADYYSLYGVFASATEPTVPPLCGPPPSTPEYEAFTKELAKREASLSEFVKAKYDELIRLGRSRVADYLLVAESSAHQPDTEDFMRIVDKGDLNPVILGRWRRLLRKTRDAHDPVLAPWHALAKLPKDGFADRSASMIAEWSSRPDESKPINPLIVKALADRPLANIGDAARAIGRALNSTESIWQDYARRAELNGSPATALPDPDHEALRTLFHGPDAPPNVAFKPEGSLTLLPDRASQGRYKELLKAVETFRVSGPGAPPRAMVLKDGDKPYDPRIFRRGSPGNKGDFVPRRFLKVIEGDDRKPFPNGSGRLDLARAIANPDNPLTGRVIVNRVWMHHFGSPIVATPSDFGVRSDPPTHPELLDYLARSFVADGWSLKRLHRRIMLSAAYRQTSDHRDDASSVDPENSLLWRMNRRRLDFEATRDSLLFVSGRMDPSIGGPAMPDLFASNATRRTLYGKIDRLNLPNVYRAFDFPDPASTNPRRDQTTVAPQALFLMNHPFAIESAKAVLARPDVAGEPDVSRRVDRLYHVLYGRSPSAEEASLAKDFLAGADPSAWSRFVQALMIANEFVFVD